MASVQQAVRVHRDLEAWPWGAQEGQYPAPVHPAQAWGPGSSAGVGLRKASKEGPSLRSLGPTGRKRGNKHEDLESRSVATVFLTRGQELCVGKMYPRQGSAGAAGVQRGEADSPRSLSEK